LTGYKYINNMVSSGMKWEKVVKTKMYILLRQESERLRRISALS